MDYLCMFVAQREIERKQGVSVYSYFNRKNLTVIDLKVSKLERYYSTQL